jgi:Txe/YoeB family toxin of Txe-Axe toxin-antitoxin module
MKTLEQRIAEIEELANNNGETFDLSVKYVKTKDYKAILEFCTEIAKETFSIIKELQEENKKLKQTQDNLVKDLTSCWDRQEACRVKDEKRCEELNEIGKLFEKFKKENESLKKCYKITNLSWKDLYKENIELKEKLKIK